MPRQRIFIYEYLSGGGLLRAAEDDPPILSLLAEGKLMLAAVAADFAHIAGCEVTAMHHDRFNSPPVVHASITWHAVRTAEEELSTFCLLAGQADWTLVIAPEFDGILVERCRHVLSSGGRLLNPPLELTELCADKHLTCEHLLACGVPAPVGIALWPDEYSVERVESIFAKFATYIDAPIILKPRFGAGSQNLQCIQFDHEIPPSISEPIRIEKYCCGVPASIAVLCGERQCFPLIPCRQTLSTDRQLRYLGGSLPITPEQSERATQLAVQAVSKLSNSMGYIGFDLVLGYSAKDDYVIEINPRITTSYIGLRQAYIGNLAAAMLTLAEGGSFGSHDLQPRLLSLGEIRWKV